MAVTLSIKAQSNPRAGISCPLEHTMGFSLICFLEGSLCKGVQLWLEIGLKG